MHVQNIKMSPPPPLRRRGSRQGAWRTCRRSTVIITASVLLIALLAYIQGRYVIALIRERKRRQGTTEAAESVVGGIGESNGEAKDVVAKTDANLQQSRACTLIPTGVQKTKAMKLWADRIATVLSSSQHPDDPQFSHKQWTKNLLAELPPSLLKSTVVAALAKANPSRDSAIRRVLQIVRDRMSSPGESPPLKIAVLGGAVAEGNGCDLASVTIPKGSIMANPTYCAWPYRLESFVNSFLGSNVVQVINMAEEGTSTAEKCPLLKYWMYPEELLPEGPDVVVHAYGASDALPFEHEGESLADAVRRELDTFAEAVKLARPCGMPPLVVNMDDGALVGGKHGEDVLGTMLSVKYSPAVERVAKVDNTEEISDADEGVVTLGMAGHVATAWVLAFNFAEAVLGYCRRGGESKKLIHRFRKVGAGVGGGGDDEEIPPTKCQDSPCIFAWLAGPTGTAKHAADIHPQIDPYVVENDGWQPATDMNTGWSRKAGLVAIGGLGSRIAFEFRDIPLSVRVVTVMTIKSYGDRWKDSLARFTLVVEGDKGREKWKTEFDISGTHRSASHITFPFKLDMGIEHKAQVGDAVRLEVQLIGGETFKILGMMLCSR